MSYWKKLRARGRATQNPHLSGTISFLTGGGVFHFHVSANTWKHSEDGWTVRALAVFICERSSVVGSSTRISILLPQVPVPNFSHDPELLELCTSSSYTSWIRSLGSFSSYPFAYGFISAIWAPSRFNDYANRSVWVYCCLAVRWGRDTEHRQRGTPSSLAFSIRIWETPIFLCLTSARKFLIFFGNISIG